MRGASKLVQAQQAFGTRLAQLLVWAHQHGHVVTVGEVERPQRLAALYAKMGIGIRQSQHTKRLAADLHLYVNGVYQQDASAYEPLGRFWGSLDPRCRWGGRFTRRDGVHFEFSHL